MSRSNCLGVVWAIIATVVMLSAQVAWSLGLGEIEVDSALNEKFAASISLSEGRDLQESEIVVSLASREDFERVGVERFHFLTSLDFEVDVSGRDPVVRLSSTRPIAEPYLNFIVEVFWPKGRLLKEFTVLLDPPTFGAGVPPDVVTAVATVSERAQSAVPERRQAATQVTFDRAGAIAEASQLFTTQDDTLWKIANRTRRGQVNVNQQMLAIQDLNPRAFIRNNINLLKAGYELALPTEEQALTLSARQAQTAVSEQVSAWRNPDDQPSLPAQQQIAASRESLQSQVNATAESLQEVVDVASEKGQVRIVAASGEQAQGGADASSESGQLIEQNETLTRRVDELEYQLDREKELAANQVELKSRELEVKDQELAALQSRLEKLAEEMASRQQNQATPNQTAELPIWQSPFVLFGVIGVLVLLLVLVLLKKRGADEDEDEYRAHHDEVEDSPGYEDTGSTIEPSIGDAEGNVGRKTNSDQPEEMYKDDLLDGLDLDDAGEADADETVTLIAGDDDSKQSSDVIGEADIYVAYGRHGQAVSLLSGALDQAPDRHDVRLKLLEVCVDAEDPVLFNEHAEYLVANCGDEDMLLACQELEASLNEQDSARANSDEDITEVVSSTVEMADDFNLDEQADVLSIDDLAEPPADDANPLLGEDEFELEFDAEDINSDEADRKTVPAGVSDDESFSFGGDLGIDFDPDQNEVEESDLGDFEFAADGDADVNTTKIDLAEAYIDMGDGDGARDILSEVLGEGTPEQQARAQELLSSLDK